MAKARKGAAQSQNLQVRHQRKSKGNKKKLISIQTRKLKQGVGQGFMPSQVAK